VEGKKIDLTTTEFRILQLLASKNGWVFTRDRILNHLWGNDKMVLDRTIDVHIKHLREKLANAGGISRICGASDINLMCRGIDKAGK
jgi:DNA-binding response OmpR family regulator